jgi:hypothetical protein
LWYVEVFQYDNDWWYVGKGPATVTFGGTPNENYRDPVKDLHNAERFERKADAEAFAFKITVNQPARLGKVRVTRR